MPLVTKPNAMRLYRQAIAQSRGDKFSVVAFEAMIVSNAGGIGAGGHFTSSNNPKPNPNPNPNPTPNSKPNPTPSPNPNPKS
eukprot:scaffold75173_cov28-Phaeocystis_antarctica.AAC.1